MNPLICSVVTAFILSHVAPIDSPAPTDICKALVLDLLSRPYTEMSWGAPMVQYNGLPRPFTIYLTRDFQVMDFHFMDEPPPETNAPPNDELFRQYRPDAEMSPVCAQYTYYELLEMQKMGGEACLPPDENRNRTRLLDHLRRLQNGPVD
jgi:hypothetical protein